MFGSVSTVNSTSTTLPRTWTTFPMAGIWFSVSFRRAALGVLHLVPLPSCARRATFCYASAFEGLRAAGDLEDLLRDRGLACLVHHQRQLVDELAGIVRGVRHRDQLRRELGSLRLEQRLEDRELHVFREQCGEHRGRIGLELKT